MRLLQSIFTQFHWSYYAYVKNSTFMIKNEHCLNLNLIQSQIVKIQPNVWNWRILLHWILNIDKNWEYYIQYSFISLNFYNNSIQLKFQYSVVCARHHDEQNALKKKKNFSFFAPSLIKWNLLNTFSILINHIPCLCLRQQGLVESWCVVLVALAVSAR